MPKSRSSSSSSNSSSSDSSSSGSSSSHSSSSSSSSGSRSRSSSSSSSSSSSKNETRSKRRPINVDKRSVSRSPSASKRRTSPVKSSKIHVGHLTRNVTKEHIHEIFSSYGTIKNVDMPPDRMHPHIGRGFCYVEFERGEDAEKATRYMNEGQIDGQEVRVNVILIPSKPRYQGRQSSPYRRQSPPRRPRYTGRRSPERRRRTPERRRSNDRNQDRRPSPVRRSRSPRNAPRRARAHSASSGSSR